MIGYIHPYEIIRMYDDSYCAWSRPSDIWGCFSLRSPYYPFIDADGRRHESLFRYWNFFKAMFFGDVDTAQRIRDAAHDYRVVELANKIEGFDKKRWDATRLTILTDGMSLQLMANPTLKVKLRATYSNRMIDATQRTEPEYIGETNLIGKCWMTARHAMDIAPTLFTVHGDVEINTRLPITTPTSFPLSPCQKPWPPEEALDFRNVLVGPVARSYDLRPNVDALLSMMRCRR